MSTTPPGIFGDTLVGDSGIGWNLGRLVVARHPGKALLDGVHEPFDLMKFARARRCDVSRAEDEHSSMRADWTRAHGLSESPVNAVYDAGGAATRCA